MKPFKSAGAKYSDFLPAAAAVVLAAALFILFRSGPGGGCAVVSADGLELERVPLRSEREMAIERDGKRNVVSVSGGKARMLEADCPDRLCVRQGEIASAGMSIVCLPNRVVIRIEPCEGLGKDGGLDGGGVDAVS